MVLLVLCAVGYGFAATYLFRRLVDAGALRLHMNRLLAHAIEFRLFGDEPVLVWRAQVAALRANLALLRLIALPCLTSMLLFGLAWTPLDGYFGTASIPAGEAAIVTSRFDRAPAVAGFAVETPGVRVARTGDVIWRVRRVKGTIAEQFPPEFRVNTLRSRLWMVWFSAISLATGIFTSYGKRARLMLLG